MNDEARLLREIGERQTEGAPWVVRLLDQGVTPDGRPFMVLPWYEFNLATWRRERQPSLERVLLALECAARAVARLHRCPDDLSEVILHRDIKPENFLVADHGRRLDVVLADLGLGRRGRLLVEAQNTGLHSVGYGPPEQQLPLVRAPDLSLDAHALAATIYATLVGRPPQAVLGRDALWTEAATRLVLLAGQDRRTPPEEDELRRLQIAPLEELLDLEHAHALLPADIQRLHSRLEEALQYRINDIESIVPELGSLLVRAIRPALEADPTRRSSDVRALYAACRQARERIEQELPARRPPALRPSSPALSKATGVASVQTPTRPAASGSPGVIAASVGLSALVALALVLVPPNGDAASAQSGPAAVRADPTQATPVIAAPSPVTRPSPPGSEPAPRAPPKDTTPPRRASPPPPAREAEVPTGSPEPGAIAPSSTAQTTIATAAPPAPPEALPPAPPSEVRLRLSAVCVDASARVRVDGAPVTGELKTLISGKTYHIQGFIDGAEEQCGGTNVQVWNTPKDPDLWIVYLDGSTRKAGLRSGDLLRLQFDAAGVATLP